MSRDSFSNKADLSKIVKSERIKTPLIKVDELTQTRRKKRIKPTISGSSRSYEYIKTVLLTEDINYIIYIYWIQPILFMLSKLNIIK